MFYLHKMCIRDRYKIKKENFVLLHPQYRQEENLAQLLNGWKGAPKQMELVLAFLHFQRTEGDVLQAALLKKSGATAAQLKGLVEKEILLVEQRSVDRIASLPKDVSLEFKLSILQQKSLEQLEETLLQKNVALLHGCLLYTSRCV